MIWRDKTWFRSWCKILKSMNLSYQIDMILSMWYFRHIIHDKEPDDPARISTSCFIESHIDSLYITGRVVFIGFEKEHTSVFSINHILRRTALCVLVIQNCYRNKYIHLYPITVQDDEVMLCMARLTEPHF